VGEDGRITYLNPAAEHLTGVSDRARARPAAGGLVARSSPLRSIGLASGDGPKSACGRTTGATASSDMPPRPWRAGHPVRSVLFQDLTELRQMEEAVRRADRLAVVGGMAAGLAHEIRNPLASMCGSIEVLGASPGLDGDERKLMNVVRGEAERLEALGP